MTEKEIKLYSKDIKIFDYIDFRDYLLRIITSLRARGPEITYRKLSAAFGFKSPNFLLLLTQKKRNMSFETGQKFCKILALSKNESEYLLLMVKSTLTKEIAVREKIAKRMVSLQKNQNQTILEPKMHDLYENWYQVILREIISLPEIPQTPQFISNFFEDKISEAQIEAALTKLNNLGLIEKKDGRWRNKDTHLKTGDFFSNTYLILFHKKMLEFAELSLTKHNGKERYLGTLTLPVSEESHQKIRELIEEFKNKALIISEESQNPNQVMQLNFQLFPISKVYHEK